MSARPPVLALLLTVLAAACLSGCDPCRKLAKSSSIADKDSAAYCYYERENFEAASNLFRELMGFYSASERGENVSYMFAMSKMQMGEMITAAYYFRQFIQRYPSSEKVEDATYYIGYAYYLQSNRYELDQAESQKAIEFFTLFLNRYPESDRVEETEKLISELRNRLAKKAYNQANLWYRLERYRAATVTFQNLLEDYPDADFREEAYFKLFVSQLEWARGSILAKKEERYDMANEYYMKYIDRFPQGEFTRKAEKSYEDLQRELVQTQERIKEEGLEEQKNILDPGDDAGRAPSAPTTPQRGGGVGGGRTPMR